MLTMREKLKQIADRYGYDAQARQLIEEQAELTVALNKEWRSRKGHLACDNKEARQNIVEELADVEIMLEQIKYLMDCEYEVFIMKLNKTDRQMERMKASAKSV